MARQPAIAEDPDPVIDSRRIVQCSQCGRADNDLKVQYADPFGLGGTIGDFHLDCLPVAVRDSLIASNPSAAAAWEAHQAGTRGDDLRMVSAKAARVEEVRQAQLSADAVAE